MDLLSKIHNEIKNKHMLLHPFYQDWMKGQLSERQLQNYARQYQPFVDAFPQFVSSTHSLCESQSARKVLLENLMDEEGLGHSPPHPELWRHFADGIGADLANEPNINDKAQDLKNTYLHLCRSSYEEGLCALYAYEYQIPEIAKAKIEGLAQHYQISDQRTTQFFSVHQEADVFHSQACAQLINVIDDNKVEACVLAAKKATAALWDFLSEAHQIQ